ncbi:hypothetical protein N9934_05070 [Desulfosarcina sp.]|nr:hypothetical protein [Desulfosarcina sp.]
MNELEELASQGLCDLLMPKNAWDEAEAGNNIERKEKTWEYFFIEPTHTDNQKFWFKEIEKIIFPNGARSQNEINDVWILVTVREMRYPLVTNDGESKSQPGGILGNRERLNKVGVITVQCIQIDKRLTEVEVTYEYTGLSEKGDEFIDSFTSTQYKEIIGEWNSLLVSYFQSKC